MSNHAADPSWIGDETEHLSGFEETWRPDDLDEDDDEDEDEDEDEDDLGSRARPA